MQMVFRSDTWEAHIDWVEIKCVLHVSHTAFSATESFSFNQKDSWQFPSQSNEAARRVDNYWLKFHAHNVYFWLSTHPTGRIIIWIELLFWKSWMSASDMPHRWQQCRWITRVDRLQSPVCSFSGADPGAAPLALASRLPLWLRHPPGMEAIGWHELQSSKVYVLVRGCHWHTQCSAHFVLKSTRESQFYQTNLDCRSLVFWRFVSRGTMLGRVRV